MIAVIILLFCLFLIWHAHTDRQFRAYMKRLQDFLRNEREQ